MNNPKILRKVLVVALTLAMVVGAFSMLGIGTSALEYVACETDFTKMPAYKLTHGGITFDDYQGEFKHEGNKTQADPGRAYLRDEAGMMITPQTTYVQHSGVRLLKEDDGNVALRLVGNAFWINGNVDNVKDDVKFGENSMLLDLFNNPNGPKEFALSFDMKVIGESGAVSGFGGTSDNGGTVLTTKYRGVSGVTLNNTWMFKITAANLPAIISETNATIAGVTAKRVELADSIPENMKDKGYIYPGTGTIVIGALEGDDLVTGGYATKPSSKTWEESGKTGSCISMEMMDMDGVGDALTYTINEYVSVKFDAKRSDDGTKLTIDTYIDGKFLGTTTHTVNGTSGNSSDWAYGIRFFDNGNGEVVLDNIKVTAPNDDFGDIHTGAWRSVKAELVEVDREGGGVAMIERCTRCGEILSETFPNVVFEGVKSVGVDSGATIADSVPGDPGTINRTYHQDIASAWETVKTEPFWMNFDLTNVTAVLGGDKNGDYNGGSSLLTWRNKQSSGSYGYTQIFRLFKGGEIRTICNAGNWYPGTSDFRLKGTPDEPGNYGFHIYIDPTTGRYDIYVDNLNDTAPIRYVASGVQYALTAAGAVEPRIRFNDANVGVYRVENFTLTKGVAPEDHIHSDALVTANDRSVVVGYDTVAPAYLCYCGTPVANGGITEVLGVADSVYYGNGEVAVPTEGDFWFATDYNIRTAEALAAVKDAEASDITWGDLEIKVDRDTITAPATYQIAVKVAYAEGAETADVEVYVNGELASTAEGVALSDTVKLGSLDTTDVRFIATKIVKAGETNAPLKATFNDTADKTLKPCAHTLEGDAKYLEGIRRDSDGNLVCTVSCSRCGEIVYDYPVVDYHDEEASGISFEDGKFTYSGAKFYYLPTEVQGEAAAPYQINFTATLDQMNSTISSLYNSGSGRNFMSFFNVPATNSDDFKSTLRTLAVSDGNGGYRSDMIELFIRNNQATPLGVFMTVGESADFSIVVDPAKNTADIYYNGVYVGTSVNDFPNKATALKFGDGPHPVITISDMSIVRLDSNHTHEATWADDSTKTVSMTDKTLKYGYECYCGEIVYDQDITAVHAETKNVYYGNASIENIPTEGNFWILTDYNVRTEEALATADNIFVLGNYAVTINENVKAKSTTQYAVNVVYTAEGVANVYLYVDGELTESLKDVEMGEATTLKLGNDGAATTDIRFNNTRVISVGDTDEPVALTFVDGVDASVRPCFHETISKFVPVAGETYTGSIKAINKLVRISDCTKCGERFYAEQGDVSDIYTDTPAGQKLILDETGSSNTPINGATYIYTKRDTISLGADPYWIAFDFTANFSAAQIERVEGKGTNGGSILAIRVPFIDDASVTGAHKWDGSGDDYAYLQLMRAFGVGRDDAIGINFYHGGASNPKFIMENGKTYNVAIWVDPAVDGYHYKAYLDGVLTEEKKETADTSFALCLDPDRPDNAILDQKNAVGERMFMFRFTDNNYGDFYVKNFSIVKAVDNEEPHVHSGAWLNEEEKAASTFTVYDDNTVAYSYQCYCGEIVSEGVSEILADGVVPAYNSTTPTTVVADGVIAHDSIFMGSAMAKELPAEGIKALISIGGQSIVSVDAEGVVYLGEAATDLTIAANEWCDFAIRSAYEGYIVYFGGEYLGVVAYEDVDTLEVTVGSEGMGKFHFDKMAVVLLSIDGDSAIEVGTDGHAHQFDPYTAELVFDESRSSITVEYVCTVCDRPAVDGIVKNLYDDEATEEIEAIYAVIGTPVGGVGIIDDVYSFVMDTSNFWFSADFTVTSMSNKNRQNVVSFMGNKLVLIDADGTLRINGETTTVIGSVKKGETFNVTFNVVDGDEAVVHVYINGKYCATYNFEWAEDLDIVAGDESNLVMDVTNIKLAELGNGGQLHIGAFVCDYHTYDYSKAVINYLDLETFVVTNECLTCGYTVTERPVHNYYAEAIAPIYNNGGITAVMSEPSPEEISISSYWIVADVNKRGNDLGSFSGYVNLIGEIGDSYVLINSTGDLMLGDGTKVGNYFGLSNGKTTYNIAVQFSDAINVYVDGKFVGSFDSENIEYAYEHTSESYEQFGASELEDVKFYNIRSFDAAPSDALVTFEYAENNEVVPCPHVYDSNTMTKTAVFGEKIQFVYICQNCGERVHLTYTENLYDETLNTAFVFDENGELTISTTTTLQSTADILGSKGAPFWLKFDLFVEEVNPELVGANNNNNNGGRNFMNFGGCYESPLRLYADKDYSTGNYYEDYLIMRANNKISGAELARIYEGESYEFALYVDPATRYVEIYVDGVYRAVRAAATDASGKTVRFLDGNWGTFTISDFEFVTGDTFDHVHTAKYSEAMGKVPTLVYGDQTLKHTFICTCGETIVEGIDKAIAEEIQDMTGITSATAIPEAAGKTVTAPYWVSAKVYGNGETASVFTYGETELVGIANGVYTIGGEATEVKVSGVATAGDYDVVSIFVDNINDDVLVYVNGVQIGVYEGADFAASENFNILLGGGASLDFKFVKVVTLASGADNKVNIYGCGDHAFGYRSGVVAEATSTGVTYKCKFCGKTIRTLTQGSAKVYTKGDGTINISNNPHYVEGDGIYSDVVAPKDGGNFVITFDLKPTDFSGLASGGKSLLCWITNGTGYKWFMRAFKIDGTSAEIKMWNGSDYESAANPIIFTTNNTYKIVIEANPTTGDYYIYSNGQYMGGSNMGISAGASAKYQLRFGDAGTGKWTVTGVKLYNPQTEKVEAPTVTDDTVIVHNHFPNTLQQHSITVENGVIVQNFKCVCGETVELKTMTDLVDGLEDEYKNVTMMTKIPVGDALNYDKGTYVVSFDFTVNELHVTRIVAANKTSGRSIVSIYDSDTQVNLLRVFGHPYVEGEGYEDTNNDGYADRVVDFRYSNSTSHPILKTMAVGDTVNITYVIDAVNQRMAIYVDDQFVHAPNAIGKISGTTPYIRLLDNSYGSFDFTNFKVVKMSDTCEHVAPSCEGGVHSGECTLCGMTVEATHNYKAVVDRTAKWTKYTCEDCGKYYVVFNDMSLVADLTFASKSELMKYLTETYFPVFQ